MRSRVSNMHEWMVRFLDDLMSKADDSSTESSQPSGFLKLEDLDFDAPPGSVRVFSAKTGDEKMDLLISAVLAESHRSSLPILLFLSEQDKTPLAYQMVSSIGQIDRKRLDTGMLLDSEWPRLTDTVEAIRVLPIHITTSIAPSLKTIEAETNRLSTELARLGMLIVDADGLTVIDRQDELAHRMDHLGKLAKEHNTSVLLFNTMSSVENHSAAQR